MVQCIKFPGSITTNAKCVTFLYVGFCKKGQLPQNPMVCYLRSAPHYLYGLHQNDWTPKMDQKWLVTDPADPTVTSHLHSNTRYCVTLKTCRTCRIMRLQWLQCAPGVECNGWSQPFRPSIHILSRPQTTMAKATAKSNCADWYYLIDVNVRFIETVETGISWKSWFPIGMRTSFFGGKDFEDLACKMLRISSNVGNVGPLKTHSLLHTAQDNKKSQANQKTVRTRMVEYSMQLQHLTVYCCQ